MKKILIIFLVVTHFNIFATVIHVPSQFTTIQDGIDVADNGDTVIVSDGTYFENNITFNGFEIVLISENGPTSTIIDGSNSGRVFDFHYGESFNSKIDGFTIQNGYSSAGSAILIYQSSYLTISNCIIKNNSTPSGPTRAAITLGQPYDNGPHTPAGIHIDNCILEGNSGYYGGGIFIEGSGSIPSVIKNCIFKNNTAKGGAAIFGTRNSSIKNCVFHNNTSTDGTSIVNNEGGSPEIINCTFADNAGYAICRNSNTANTTIRNCIFYGNTGTWCQITNPSTIIMQYNNDQDNNNGIGNINLNPLFNNPLSGDYTLQVNSPCIDSGDPNLIYNDPDGTRNDMGAYFFPQCSDTNVTHNVNSCDSYFWNANGNNYTQSGTYTEQLSSQFGCDSTVTLNLTINSSSSSNQIETALDSYTWPVNNQTYNESGIYTAIIPNNSGCDSTITLNLNLDFTGIKENGSTHLYIYPNPTTSMLTIEGQLHIGQEYEIIDLYGKVIQNGIFNSSKEMIDLKPFEIGNYILKIEEKQFKIIKN